MSAIPTVNETGSGHRIASRKPKRPKKQKKMIAFGWYGGKYSHLGFLKPLIPEDATHFCDVYGGSAAVLINAGPYPFETYNDIDPELVNFFRTLRNQGPKLIKAISLTPFSREELAHACEPATNLSARARPPVLYPSATDQNRTCADQQRRPMGALRADLPRKHGRRSFEVAGLGRGPSADNAASATRANRERTRDGSHPTLRHDGHDLLPRPPLHALHEGRRLRLRLRDDGRTTHRAGRSASRHTRTRDPLGISHRPLRPTLCRLASRGCPREDLPFRA